MAGFGTFGPVVEPKSVTRERPERGVYGLMGFDEIDVESQFANGRSAS